MRQCSTTIPSRTKGDAESPGNIGEKGSCLQGVYFSLSERTGKREIVAESVRSPACIHRMQYENESSFMPRVGLHCSVSKPLPHPASPTLLSVRRYPVCKAISAETMMSDKLIRAAVTTFDIASSSPISAPGTHQPPISVALAACLSG